MKTPYSVMCTTVATSIAKDARDEVRGAVFMESLFPNVARIHEENAAALARIAAHLAIRALEGEAKRT